MNVLIVDDDDAMREQLSKFVSTLGHTTFRSSNGKGAIELLARERINLILTDIQMPEMDGHELLKEIKKAPGLENVLVILLTGYGDVKDAVESMREGAYDYILKPMNLKELTIIIKKAAEYLALKEENIQLTKHFKEEVSRAVKDIKKELDILKKAYIREVGKVEVLVKSKVFEEVVTTAKKLHDHPDVPALIEGETGTGKEIVARLIHYGKGDSMGPFVGLNCAIITPSLFESELFGYEPGAFTGGNPKGQKGKIELAAGGSLFLDEITELPINFQAKLLRVIQEREFYRVGGIRVIETDARFVCATNQNIRQKVSEGLFRDDLFFRLNIGYIRIPPLRERKEDIIPLARLFLNQLADQGKTKLRDISGTAADFLVKYPWPGNVRELKNVIERVALFSDGDRIQDYHLNFLISDDFHGVSAQRVSPSFPQRTHDEGKASLPDLTYEIVEKALKENNGNKTKTALSLGISLRVLHRYLQHIE